MLDTEKVKFIKNQIIENIEKNFPEDRRKFAIEQIENLEPEELEEFLKNNGIGLSENSEQQCIFCSINSGKIDSYNVGENAEAIAILEINPISKGHTIIIPKKHSEKIEEKSKEIKKLVEIA